MPSTKFATGKQRLTLELSIWITIQQTWNFISYIMMYYEVSTHAILQGCKPLGIHMCLEGFLSLFWTRKQKYLHLLEISCLPLYSFYSIKLSCQNSNYLLMVLQHTQTFLFGLNNRGVGQITSNVVTFQWMWQWWSFLILDFLLQQTRVSKVEQILMIWCIHCTM